MFSDEFFTKFKNSSFFNTKSVSDLNLRIYNLFPYYFNVNNPSLFYFSVYFTELAKFF